VSDDRRKFPRFNVHRLNELKAKIDRHRTFEQVITLGIGGCGFYGTLESKHFLTPVKRVFSIFEFEGVTSQPVEIQGNLLYARDIQLNDEKIVFFGVEFIEAHQKLIEPIVQKLEALKEAGKVNLAP